MKYKVCLIVDNPLRDLQGIILIASHLANLNVKCYIVPMYCQAFDIIAIKPDMVVVNYLRPNNVDLIKRYKKENIKICILDTEGSPGRDLNKFSESISKIKEKDLVDLYCLWGHDQYKSFKSKNLFNDNIIKITGCPRYDFCSYPYNETLPDISYKKPFILINTTFPVGNPKFTLNHKIEAQAMIDMGYEENFAEKYAEDSLKVNIKMIKVISQICKKFPKHNFVLRPHPFESTEPYKHLLNNSNFEIRQEGSAIEWLNRCEALIHLNCQTAIEAAMLGKEAISIEWINTNHLKSQSPPGEISHTPSNLDELVHLLNAVLLNKKIKPSKKMTSERKKLIASRLYINDGNSSLRASEAILDGLITNKKSSIITFFSFKQAMRETLGFKFYHILRKLIQGKKSEFRRNEKSFDYTDIELIVKRLKKIDHFKKIKVSNVDNSNLSKVKMFSQNSIKIST